MLRFISLTDDTGRKSTLSAIELGGPLQVVGVLPHGTRFFPTTEADRDLLVKHLQSIPYYQTEE